jgi:trimeric autotransporter adhesin
MELKPGSKLGPYEIVSAIGKGGMGEAWKVRDTRLGRRCEMKYCSVAGLFVALLLAGNAWPQGVITSFAGGPFPFPGNGQPAVNAPLGLVIGVALDPAGNLVIADSGNDLVERVNPDGTLSVIAGNGLSLGLHTGDGGPALNAALNAISGVAYDSLGNLYIAEADRISQVSPQGIITTIAGGGSDSTSNGIPALQAALSPFGGLAVDAAGAVFFTEYSNNRVRKLTSGGTIATVAGTGAAGFSGDGGPASAAVLNGPYGLALDGAGNLYIADIGNDRIRKVTPAGIISTVIPNVIASGLAFDNNGVAYLAGDGAVYKIAPGASSPTLIGGVSGSAGYSGDGGPAAAAQFAFIISIVADPVGNLFIGDGANDRVRRISTNGIVTTVAGNGQYLYAGEGLPATTSPVQGGGNLAIDKAGNIYYSDPLGSRVREVSGGVINTVVGTGIQGFSGDGGPALQATVNYPRNLTFDATGNLYIADYLNYRVRKVALDGTISTYAQLPGEVRGLVFDAAGNLYAAVESNSTVYRINTAGNQTVFAGTGSAGYSGDGGPASRATLNGPSGLAMDTAGNLYIADSQNGCVRVVNRQGVINTYVGGGANTRELAFDTAGNLYVSDETRGIVYKVTPSIAVSIFAGGGTNKPGNGLLATQVLLTPYGILSDAAGNLYIDDVAGIQVVLASPPTISLGQNSLSVSAASGGAPVTQNVTVLSAVQGLAFTVSANTASGGNWLSAGTASGNTPDLLSITADPTNLMPGSYTGTITITPVAATPAVLTLTVTFTVGAALAPQLSVDQPSLSFTYPNGAPARSETLKVSNAGGGALAFTVSATTQTGGTNSGNSWLSVAPVGGSVSPGAPVALTVTANPSNLATGTYTGSISIQSNGGGTITVPVNLAISSLSQALLLTQTGVSFTGVAQGGVVPPQSFGVVNLGTGSLSWTASASTLAGGNWLSATPASGSSSPSQAAPQVTINMNQSGLAAGDYYGLVRIDAPGAANTPQVVTVFLTVLPVGSDPGASIQPSELFFQVAPNAESPGSQEVLVYSIGAAAQTFYTGYPSEATVIRTLPYGATLNPSHPTRFLVEPIGSFTAGTYSDSVTFQFSDGRVQTLKVNVIAATPAAGSNTGGLRPRDSSTPCAPTKPIPALTTLSPSFAVSAGWPVALNVQSVDDCGNPQTSGSVTVRFSTGDPPLALSSLNDGTWQATWATAQNNVGQPVTLTVTAANNQLQLSGTSQVVGGLSSPKTPPAITQAGIVSAASPLSFTALAPGGIIAIYGNLLADDALSAPSFQFPLPTTLGNAQVIIAGESVPLLYVSPGQINALVPFGLNMNTTYSLLIQRDLALSSPVPINIADAQPGAFQSSGSAIVEDYRGTAPAFLVTPSAPAKAGDVLVFYCAGLGVTNPPVGDGVASPSNPTAQTQSPVMVTIGGQNATVVYAGLVAGLVGLYQLNVDMPSGVTPGNAVPVLLTVAGQTSPAATISTQ